MNKKLFIPLIGLLIVIIAFVLVLSQGKPEEEKEQALVNRAPVCAQVPEEQKMVKIGLAKDESFQEKGKVRYRAEVETLYPVNVVGLALRLDPKELKFEAGDYSNSAFSIQAPTDEEGDVLKLNRGIVGAGLLGKGEFGLLTFEVLKGTDPKPEMVLEETEAFFSNGCAEKARIIIQKI